VEVVVVVVIMFRGGDVTIIYVLLFYR